MNWLAFWSFLGFMLLGFGWAALGVFLGVRWGGWAFAGWTLVTIVALAIVVGLSG